MSNRALTLTSRFAMDQTLEAAQEVWRGVWVIAWREFLRFFRERSLFVAFVASPIILLIVIGIGLDRIIGSLTSQIDYMSFLLPGVIAINVASSSVSSALSVVWDREFGFLKEVMVAPISRTGIVLGKAIGGGVVSLTRGLTLLIVAPVVGVSVNPQLVLKLIPVLIIFSLFLGSLGILIASRMRSMRGFSVVRQLIEFPLVFLSGAFFPVDILPVWLQVVSKVNPVTYGVDAVRQVFLGEGFVIVFGHTMSMLEALLVLIVLGTVLMIAAVWSFSRQE